ncbi:PPE family protein [Candidatus Mycobacterium wuenschmannii]|uniref:PPE family protein n=1 Tax=Candidatus Mycobacterium wuenschmannii TaxID=3027808 RepID=A0ABY8VRK2_9MYCO|nr:PPE family protein [Candidatus Mycobacterium wuenschmannii]WIM85706.1 PPE family protein [Candidatus Mycobacterium wuenschmannii]
MDFGLYPPEINSGRMYSGPGSGPMLAAAQAWMALADELYTAAGGYHSVVSELTSGAWSGPSSSSMNAAAASFVEWLSATAAQAEQSATQAQSAAAGYETAFAMTVPPPVIAANRSLLATLVATNFFGQNTPAIAATEVQYAEMWIQDAVAMYGYAASSAAATALAPFTQPQQTTDPASSSSQAAAVGQAVNTAAGNAQSAVSSAQQAFSAVPQALQGLATADSAAAPAATDPLDTLADLITVFFSVPSNLALFTTILPIGIAAGPVDLVPLISATSTGLHTDQVVSGWNGEAIFGTGPAPVQPFPAPLSAGASTVSAGLGEANMVGGLSVPSNWTVAAPEVKPAAFTSPLAGANAAAAPAAEAGAANTVNQMGIGGMAGQAMAGPPGAAGAVAENGRPVRLVGSESAATADDDDDAEATPAPRTVMTGVAAAIRDITQQRDAGLLTEQDYAEQKKHLLQISFGQ